MTPGARARRVQAEALSTSIGIMSKGVMRCLGAAQAPPRPSGPHVHGTKRERLPASCAEAAASCRGC